MLFLYILNQNFQIIIVQEYLSRKTGNPARVSCFSTLYVLISHDIFFSRTQLCRKVGHRLRDLDLLRADLLTAAASHTS